MEEQPKQFFGGGLIWSNIQDQRTMITNVSTQQLALKQFQGLLLVPCKYVILLYSNNTIYVWIQTMFFYLKTPQI